MKDDTSQHLTAPYLVLSIVDANGGQIEGRTRIQKVAYFLNKDGQYKVEFSPNYYGPFSLDVENALQTLVSFGLVVETMRTPTLADADKVVFEPRLYTYTLTEKGREVLQKSLRPENRELLRIREELVKMKKAKGGFSTKTLSSASKIDFILSRLNRRASFSEISKMAKKLGWDLSPDEIESVVDFLVYMGLASKS